MDDIRKRFASVKALFQSFGREHVLVNIMADGRGVAEIFVRVVVFEPVQLAQSPPFVFGNFDDGIRFSAYITVRGIGGIARVAVEVASGRFPRKFALVVVVREFIHRWIIAQKSRQLLSGFQKFFQNFFETAEGNTYIGVIGRRACGHATKAVKKPTPKQVKGGATPPTFSPCCPRETRGVFLWR